MVEIIKYSASSAVWGFFIGIFCILLFYVLIKGWWKNAHFGCVSYLIGAVLGIVLIYQSILICGSIAIIKAAGSCEPVLEEIVNQYSDNAEKVMTPEESDKIMKDLTVRNPLVAYYIDGADFEGYTARELPHAMVSQLKSYMGWFVFRRILWSLGLSVFAAVLVNKMMSKQFQPHSERERSRQRVTKSDRERVSRRRR